MLPDYLRVAPALRVLYRGKADPCSAVGTSGTGPLLPPAPFPCPCHSWIIQRKASLCSMASGISTGAAPIRHLYPCPYVRVFELGGTQTPAGRCVSSDSRRKSRNDPPPLPVSLHPSFELGGMQTPAGRCVSSDSE